MTAFLPLNPDMAHTDTLTIASENPSTAGFDLKPRIPTTPAGATFSASNVSESKSRCHDHIEEPHTHDAKADQSLKMFYQVPRPK